MDTHTHSCNCTYFSKPHEARAPEAPGVFPVPPPATPEIVSRMFPYTYLPALSLAKVVGSGQKRDLKC